jgi:hypothetical protein
MGRGRPGYPETSQNWWIDGGAAMRVDSPPITKTPLEKMCASFPDARPRGNGWYRNPDNPTFDFLEDEQGNVKIHSWTGRSVESIMAMGNPPLKWADLYATKGQYSREPRRDKLDLVTFSHYLKIPDSFLLSLGYSDNYTYHGNHVVKLGGYCAPDGSEHSRVKVRCSLSGDKRFYWDEDTPGKPIACGLNRLASARDAGGLFLGEGESDAVTMWFHEMPYLGISGAESLASLDVSLLAGVPAIFIIEEPDQVAKLAATGRGFYASARRHLRDGGYTGLIFSIRFYQATGFKDPSALHKELWDTCDIDEPAPHLSTVKTRFAEVMAKALSQAIPEGSDQEQDYPHKEVDITAILEENKRLAAENARLTKEVEWTDRLCALDNQKVSAAQKLVLRALRKRKQGHEDEWFECQAWQLKPDTGLKEGAIYDALNYCKYKLQVIDKRVVKDWSSGEMRTPAQVSVKDVFDYPHLYDPPKERNHGGDRPKCKHCGSENIDRYKVTYCRDCKQWSHEVTSEAPLDYDAVDQPVERTSQIDHPVEEEIQQSIDAPIEVPTSQVDDVLPLPIDSQLDYSDESESVPIQSDEEQLLVLGERLNYPLLELSAWSKVAPGQDSWQKFKRFNPTKVAAMLTAALLLIGGAV